MKETIEKIVNAWYKEHQDLYSLNELVDNVEWEGDQDAVMPINIEDFEEQLQFLLPQYHFTLAGDTWIIVSEL